MEIGEKIRRLHKEGKVCAREKLRDLIGRFPVLVEMALLPALKPWRYFAYRFFPALGHVIAARFYVRGDLDGAREELAAAGISGPVAEKIEEIESVISKGGLARPASPHELKKNIRRKPQSGQQKIGVVHALHNALPLDQAGYAQRSQALLKAQIEQKIAIFPHTRPGYPYDLGRRSDPDIGQETMVGDITYHHIDPHSSLRRTASEREYIRYYAIKLAKAAQDHQAQIIHGHSNYLNGIAAAWAAKWSGRKSVYEARGLWHLTRASIEPSFRNSPVFTFQQIMELEAMKQADAVIALSAALKDWMAGHGIPARKIHVIGNAIDAESIHLPPRDDDLAGKYDLLGRIVVGYAGSLAAYEGLDLLLEALRKCLDEDLDMALLIVGEGREKRRLEQLTRQLDLTSHVHFAGKVPPQKIPAFLALFDICALPRLDLPVCNLVPPLKPLEIMAAGKPLIVSALPPLLEFGKEKKSRLSFAPGNADTLAAKLKQLALDTSLRRELGKAARNWVTENGSWRQNARKYMRLYENLCDD